MNKLLNKMLICRNINLIPVHIYVHVCVYLCVCVCERARVCMCDFTFVYQRVAISFLLTEFH